MKTLIKGGWVIDPSQNINKVLDILIEEGKIKDIKESIECENATVIEAHGKYIVPGLLDMHVHFRDPGQTQKETLYTGGSAAVAGGFSSIVCMPNTDPILDNENIVRDVYKRGQKALCRIYAMGSITKGLEGKEQSSYETMKKAGIVGLTDDGKTVMNTKMMYEAMKKAKELSLVVSTHCEDDNLTYDRSIHQGEVAQKMGVTGVPPLAEEMIISRDILLAKETGCSVHIQHISTRKGVDMVRNAKKQGILVTCEVTPHHFTLTDEEVLKVGTNAKMSPPLRTREDIKGIIEGLMDGTIDVIATDHAPHTVEDKQKDLVKAANGIVGLETSLGLALTYLVHTKKISLYDLVNKMSTVPSKILNLDRGTLNKGKDADLTFIDLNKQWIVDKEKFYSKGRNTPFDGWKLKGKAVKTMVSGKVVYEDK